MLILEFWKNTLDLHLKRTTDFLLETRSIAECYEKLKKNKFEIGFNVFTISSDFYYRENFHSDIIKSLLDPAEKHNERNKYLFIFIDLLNKFNTKFKIDKFDFENAVVQRERHNIDILITDLVSHKAILIENKINNAIDQPKQIPNYYSKISEQYTVEAIVYLTLNSSKRPQKNDWTNEDILAIDPILSIIPSYDRIGTNLFNDWIAPSIIEANNLESLFLLRQYGNLIKFLNTNSMDTISLEKFYDKIKENDNLQTSISIKNMLNDLPEYLAVRIEDRYKNNCHPFKNVWRYQKVDTVFEAFTLGDLYLKMDVWCSENGYKVYFWNSKDEDYDMKYNLSNLTSLKDFDYDQGKIHNISKSFSFLEEEKLFDFIDLLIKELKEVSR